MLLEGKLIAVLFGQNLSFMHSLKQSSAEMVLVNPTAAISNGDFVSEGKVQSLEF